MSDENESLENVLHALGESIDAGADRAVGSAKSSRHLLHLVRAELAQKDATIAALKRALEEIRDLPVFAHHATAHDIAARALLAGAEKDGR